jgi:hypothetical protein
LYLEVGVSLYWVVDIDAKLVDVWTPEARFPTVEHDALPWHPAVASEPFRAELAELFRPL